ncbi:type VI secretion system baseplate subunit TssK [Kosakonia sp. H7A]|uniref:type VI secretion system baseplate subunit TssK n=1 Tax=Kosakonia sp. H7A TaxID=2054598 RepID=UPI000D15D18E|nr:type VI secretion system baseplate subunit TssK [Kosakonia sp. H7A]PTA88985.1 type VI secretion system baseplate subunit TssK [Kosakonia sp. H7A]
MNHSSGSVFWHQGMFIQPQHFQLETLSWRGQLKPFYEGGYPFFWGVGSLEFDLLYPGSFSIAVRQGNFLFQDSTYTEFPGNALIETRSYELNWFDKNKLMRVYVGLKRMKLTGSNVTMTDENTTGKLKDTRFITLRNNEMPDLYSDGPAVPVMTLKYNIKIIFDHEITNFSDYLCIPVAILEITDGGVRFSENYIPPMFKFDASHQLQSKLRSFQKEMSGYLHQLSYNSLSESYSSLPVNFRDMGRLMMYQALSSSLPLIDHIMHAPGFHPWHIYSSLIQLAGMLRVYTGGETDPNGDQDVIPPYDHLELDNCFTVVIKIIGQSLSQACADREVTIRMTATSSGYSAEFPQGVLKGDFGCILALSNPSVNGNGVLRESLMSGSRLAAPVDLDHLIHHAMPGLNIIPLSSPPHRIRSHPGTEYFEIQCDGKLWENVVMSGQIALLWSESSPVVSANIIIYRN